MLSALNVPHIPKKYLKGLPLTPNERFIQLSWQLLEHKCRYYILDNPLIQDYEYDILEKEYDALADKLGQPKSVSDMVGFNEKRHSCRQVIEKLCIGKVI